ncbi:MAG: RHS repeat-associated core domain-containing protein, partial [Thermoplasmata archaeon]|nr:RHS repeat-associated core domain-containing protein [Thermoplasmata archaeon]
EPAVQEETTYDLTYLYQGPQPHAATRIGNRIYEYDLNGNQRRWCDLDDNDCKDNDHWHYLVWSEENRVRNIREGEDDDTDIQFLYNADGERTHKLDDNGNDGTLYVNQFFTFSSAESITKHVYVDQTRLATNVHADDGYGNSIVDSSDAEGCGAETFQDVIDALQEIVDTNPGSDLADKIEDTLDSARLALYEMTIPTPDNLKVLGNIEGIVGDIIAAVDDGLLDSSQGIALMDQLACIARTIAVKAIEYAIASGGDPDTITEAQEALDEGDELRESGLSGAYADFKDAINAYKNALSKAESLIPDDNSIISWYHADRLGSTNYVTKYTGNIIQYMEYFAAGETWVEGEDNKSELIPYLFNGKEFDEETGLHYYGARYYDSRRSLWISPDPLLNGYIDSKDAGGVFDPITLALYAYGRNSPANFVDPIGLQPEKPEPPAEGKSLSTGQIFKIAEFGIQEIKKEHERLEASGSRAWYRPIVDFFAAIIEFVESIIDWIKGSIVEPIKNWWKGRSTAEKALMIGVGAVGATLAARELEHLPESVDTPIGEIRLDRISLGGLIPKIPLDGAGTWSVSVKDLDLYRGFDFDRPLFRIRAGLEYSHRNFNFGIEGHFDLPPGGEPSGGVGFSIEIKW